MMGERLSLPLPRGNVEIVVVLVGVTHPGNLGAICRGMLNYGYADLRLVNPECSVDDDETRARAKHAQRVLDGASHHTGLEDAVRDCRAVIGTSGKREVGEKTLFRHYLYPWDMVAREERAGGRVALVFGEEGKGLSKEDLTACDYFVTLPTWEGYPIANLSHAVNALLYEAHRARVLADQGVDPALPDIVPVDQVLSPELRKTLLDALYQFSTSLNGPHEKIKSIEQTLKRTLLKGTPSNEESTRLIGAFVEATTALEFSSGDPNWQKDHRRKLR
jgi:TrmH family RNA methyltransferase